MSKELNIIITLSCLGEGILFSIMAPLVPFFANLIFLVVGIILFGVTGLFAYLFTSDLLYSKKIDKFISYLKTILDENEFSIRPFERKLYSRDSAALPSIVMLLFKTTPDIIIKIKEESKYRMVLQYARENKIPITLSAGKTSLMAGTVPIVGGIVLDIMENDDIFKLDEENLQVTVGAGTIWQQLLEFLEFRGYTLGSYPTSSPASTVGGWISTGGIGIGSFKNGGICDQVIDIKFISLNGEIFNTNPQKIGTSVGMNMNMLGLGTEGTLGLILEATLKIYHKPEARSNHTITFSDQNNMIQFINEIVNSDLTPFHVEWKDVHFVKLLKNIDMDFKEGDSLVFVSLDGSNEVVEAEKEILQGFVMKWKGHDHGNIKSLEEWNERFYPMRVKRLGPSILGGEVLIPTKNIDKALVEFEKIGKFNRTIHGVEGVLGPRTSTTALCDVLVDERKFFSYLFSVSAIIDVVDTGFKLEGRNYTLNAWNSFYMNRVFNGTHNKINKNIKKEFDSGRILQSYKTVDTPKTILGLKFRPFMFTAVLNALKLINNYVFLGILLASVGGFLAIFTLLIPQGFFMQLYTILISGNATLDGMLEPIIDIHGLFIVSWNLQGLVGWLLNLLDFKIIGTFSWIWFIGIALMFIGILLASSSYKISAAITSAMIPISIVLIILLL